MKKADVLFNDCLNFWKRMGIEKDYNLKCMAALDVVFTKCDGWEKYNNPGMLEDGRKLNNVLKEKKYDENRGRENWLKGKGF